MSIIGLPSEYEGDPLRVRFYQLTEAREIALAGELVRVENEQEFDQFRGSLARDVWVRPQRGYQNSSSAQHVMKQAKKYAPAVVVGGLGALPHSPRDVSQAVVEGVRQGLRWVEYNLWSGEVDGTTAQQFDVDQARRYVRFVGRAIDSALRAPRDVRPSRVAQLARVDSARRYAAALVPRLTEESVADCETFPSRGRWTRRDGTVVVNLGVIAGSTS